MSANNYWLRGGIQSGDVVYLVTESAGGIGWLATEQGDPPPTAGSFLVFNQGDPTIANVNSPIPFTVTLLGSNNVTFTMTDGSGNGITSTADSGGAPVLGVPTPFNISPSSVVNNFDVALAGIDYMVNSSTDPTFSWVSYTGVGTCQPPTDMSPFELIPITPLIRFVPAEFYTGTGCPVNTTPVTTSEEAWYVSTCSSTAPPAQAWTSPQDCTNGDFYNYCPAGQTCGTSGCYGPCAGDNPLSITCTFSSPATFTCPNAPPTPPTDTVKPFYKEPLFWAVIGGLIFLIILGILFTASKKKSSS